MKQRNNSRARIVALVAQRWRDLSFQRLLPRPAFLLASVLAVFAPMLVFVNPRPSSAAPAPGRFIEASSRANLPGLSANGELLYRFEEFLHKRFGTTPVSVRDSSRGSALEFVACRGGCGPLALYDPYFDTFTGATGLSGLSVSASKYTDQNFGNYGVPVAVGGHLVVCSTPPTKFLILYADAISFTLGCMEPLDD